MMKLSFILFQEIPETIGSLKQLVTLKLDENQLTALPKTIGKLSNLEEFILSQNDFETLPPCIGLLRKLNILNVDDNLLEELPPGKAFSPPPPPHPKTISVVHSDRTMCEWFYYAT
jgi:Leucine-rich repeat (LRR) protein